MILTAMFLALAAAAKAIKDLCASGGLSRWGKFFDEMYSWKFKWKLDADGNVITPLEEKFFGSSTFLVSLTSGFHLAQLVEYIALFAALIPLYTPITNSLWIDFCVYTVAHRCCFEICHRTLKGK